MTWIQTYSGKIIDFDDIQKSEIDIRDIAHGLSNTCRYAGQCRSFYSVATHSFLLSSIAEDVELAKYLLLHDATEAYMVDLPKPLKSMIPKYEAIEAELQDHIFEFFGLADYDLYRDKVHEYDKMMLYTEKDVLLPRSMSWSDENTPRFLHMKDLIRKASHMTTKVHQHAEACFLSQYNYLFEQDVEIPDSDQMTFEWSK